MSSHCTSTQRPVHPGGADGRMGGTARHEGPVAGPDAGAQAAHAGSPWRWPTGWRHRLGADDEAGILPRAAADRLRRQEPVRRRRECEQGGRW